MNVSQSEFIGLESFKAYIQWNKIPPLPPIGTSIGGHDFYRDPLEQLYATKEHARNHGMYAIVDQRWTGKLAEWIDGRQVLEVMAGRGWLAKALSDHGCRVIATDNMSWTWRSGKPVYEVENLKASAAIRKYGKRAEVLLVSWPPYSQNAIFRAVKRWDGRPIVYIGETEGGCTGCEAFYQVFVQDDDAPEFPLHCWPGIHDYVQIGKIDMARYNQSKTEKAWW